jgi:hypothetical protein
MTELTLEEMAILSVSSKPLTLSQVAQKAEFCKSTKLDSKNGIGIINGLISRGFLTRTGHSVILSHKGYAELQQAKMVIEDVHESIGKIRWVGRFL